MKTIKQGFSLTEVLIALAILGILLSLGVSQLKPPAARTLAESVRASIQQARFSAIKRNRAVAVVFYSDRIETRINTTSQATSCDAAATELIHKLAVKGYGAAKISKRNSDASPTSLYWLPSGQARRCTGGFYADTVAVSVNDSVYHVITNQGVRTRIERVN